MLGLFGSPSMKTSPSLHSLLNHTGQLQVSHPRPQTHTSGQYVKQRISVSVVYNLHAPLDWRCLRICSQGIQDVLRLQGPSVSHGNTVEMSSIIYANKHCEMTSFTPPPIAALPGDPVALKEELLGNIEGELAQEPCLGYLRTWQTEPCISACPPGGRVPAKKDLGGLGERRATGRTHTASSGPPGYICLNKWP